MANSEHVRVLGRQVARELTAEEIQAVAGGRRGSGRDTNCNTASQCIHNDDFIDVG